MERRKNVGVRGMNREYLYSECLHAGDWNAEVYDAKVENDSRPLSWRSKRVKNCTTYKMSRRRPEVCVSLSGSAMLSPSFEQMTPVTSVLQDGTQPGLRMVMAYTRETAERVDDRAMRSTGNRALKRHVAVNCGADGVTLLSKQRWPIHLTHEYSKDVTSIRATTEPLAQENAEIWQRIDFS